MLPSASSSLLSYTLPQWIQMRATLHFPSIQPSGVLPSPMPIHYGPAILLDEAFILLLDLELFLLGELFPCLGALLKVAVHGREVTLLEVMNHLGLCWSHDLEGGAGVGTTTQSRGRGRGGHYNSAKGEGQGRELQLSQGGGARAGTTTQPRGRGRGGHYNSAKGKGQGWRYSSAKGKGQGWALQLSQGDLCIAAHCFHPHQPVCPYTVQNQPFSSHARNSSQRSPWKYTHGPASWQRTQPPAKEPGRGGLLTHAVQDRQLHPSRL